MRRRLALFVVAAVLLIASAALLVHAPFVRARVLRYALATLQDQYGIRVDAARLDYNLLSLRVGLAGVRISAVGKQPPFFEADYVSVTVPRRTLLGDVSFDEVAVTNGLVRIVRTASGEANLPESTAAAADEPEPLRIGRLQLSPLRLDVRDEAAMFSLTVPAAVVELTADGGRVALTEPATLRVGDQGTRITALEGDARFDGRTIYLAGVQVEAEEGRARLDGPITVIANDPSLDLRVDGAGDVGRLARWGMAQGEVPRGSVRFAGRVAGPMSGPTADLDVTAPRITWEDVTLSNVAATAHLTPDVLTVDVMSPRITWEDVTLSNVVANARLTPDVLTITRAAFDIEGGQISGSALVGLAGEGAFTARVRADTLIRLENRPTPFIPLAMPGQSRLAVANGTWRLDGQHRVAGVAPATLALRGRLADDLLQSTITGDVRVPDADLPEVVAALRRADLVDVPADTVPAGRMRAEAQVTGTFARPRVAFTAASDSLRVASPSATGPVSITGTFDTGTERYTFDSMLTDWVVAPTSDIPLAGRVNATFRGSGRAAEVMAEGEVSAREVAWQDVAIGDVAATVNLDPQLAHIVATVPQFNATADARVATTAPYTTSLTARVDQLDLERILGMVETPLPIEGTTTLALRAEGPLETWRAGAADLEITTLEAKAGDLPVRLLGPASVRYRGERIAIDRLEAAAGETHISASGEIDAFGTPNPGLGTASLGGGIIATITGDVDEVARTVAATGVTAVPVAGGSGPVALLARVAGSLEAPLVSADLEVGPGAITLTDLPTISDLRVRAHVEDGWIDLREAHAVYQGATATGTGRAPLSLLGVPVPGAAPGEASLRAKVTGVTAAVLEPFLDASASQEVSGSVDATVSLDTPSLDLSALRGELQLDRLDLRVADLPVSQLVPTRIVARDGFARVEAWDWSGQGARIGVRGQVRLADLQTAILTNGEIDLRMGTPFVRAAGLAMAGSLQPRLSITGTLTNPRIDGDLQVIDAEMRLVDPRVVISDLNGRAVLTGSTVNLTSTTGSINGGSLTAEGSAELGTGGQINARLVTGIRSMALEFPQGLRSELDADLQLLAVRGAGTGRSRRPPRGHGDGAARRVS